MHDAAKHMLSELRARGLLWPAAATVAGVVFLIALGNWQMRRLAWKEGLVAAIAERAHAPALPIEEALMRATVPGLERRWNLDAVEYQHVHALGKFDHAQERYVYEPREEGPGWLVFTPLYLKSESNIEYRANPGLCAGRVIVNRGWAPDALKDPASRPAGQVEGDVDVEGLLRQSTPGGMFTPKGDPKLNTFYARDVVELYGTACHPIKDRPLIIDAAAEPPNPGGWPKGGVTRLELPNRHLEYALTWYGLAAALVGVFAAFTVTRWRQPRP